MGVLKTLTNEYFGETIREEDKIDISGLDVEIVSFKDNNGIFHGNGYRVKDGDPNKMVKTLKTLIERIIEKRGPECSLNDIDVSNQTKMCYENKDGFIIGVFYCLEFDGDVSGWDVSNVKDMRCMFWGAKSFNQPLDKWDVSSVKIMRDMFHGANSFNQDISGWKVSSVENMKYMFRSAKSFNGDISGWDVRNVKDMFGMFYGAESFNQPLDKWGDKLLNVKNMNSMFFYANSFNQDISGWDVSNVEDMRGMFYLATSFNQDISRWDVSNVRMYDCMFDYTPLKNNNKLPKWYLDRIK